MASTSLSLIAHPGSSSSLGLGKVKTVGYEYMVAAGVPRGRLDHAHVIAELALPIRDYYATNQVKARRLSFRIGINSGPVTAGIIGTHEFSYDLWGDTVNAASRMESEGVPVSQATHEVIRNEQRLGAASPKPASGVYIDR